MKKITLEGRDASLEEAEKVFRMHALTGEEIATIWNAVEVHCLYQMEEKKGPFFHRIIPLIFPHYTRLLKEVQESVKNFIIILSHLQKPLLRPNLMVSNPEKKTGIWAKIGFLQVALGW